MTRILSVIHNPHLEQFETFNEHLIRFAASV